MAGVQPTDELSDEPSDFGSLKPGTRLGRYELLVPIARGGMARVWAARQHGQRGFQKLVAIKTILPHLAEEPEFERMFLDEARIASGVHHPNVCEIYELGEDRRTLYLAMEWVSGDSLSRVLRSSGRTEAIDVRVAARVVADACAGVHAAHELVDEDGRALAVVHRDMSPHNVLITADGVTKVCDFGVAKALGQLHEQTSVGQLKGKISYMSPEQVTGAAVDRRSDVFSLGCVLYEATTSVRPFQGERDHMVLNAILKNEVALPTSVLRNYPPALEHIVMRALSPKPILRFSTAERMRFALEEFLAKGQLVTQSNVGQVVRARIGDLLDRRKEKIKQASSVAEQPSWDPSTISRTREQQDHRSGVKPTKALTQTLPLAPGNAASPAADELVESIEPVEVIEPSESFDEATAHGFELPSSSTIPQAARAEPAPRILPTSEPPKQKSTVKFAAVVPPPGSLTPQMGVPSAPVAEASVPSDPPRPPPSFRSLPVPSSPMLVAPSSGPPAAFPVPAVALVELPAPEGPAGAGHYILAALIGLVLAILIGGGGFFVWRTQMAPRPQPGAPLVTPPAPTTPPVPTPAPIPPPAPAPVPTPEPPLVEPPRAGATATPTATPSAKVHPKPAARPRDPVLPDNPF